MSFRALLGTFAALIYIAEASIYPQGSLVREVLDGQELQDALKLKRASMVAFVGNDCATCAQFGQEFTRAALGLYPYIPLFSVDCDSGNNGRICAEHDVEELPAVKFFPRGDVEAALPWDADKEKLASGFYHWATLAIPHDVKKYPTVGAVRTWTEENLDKHRALLLNTSPKIPLLWQTIANEHKDDVVFASHRDRKGRSSKELGLSPSDGKTNRILLYPAGEREGLLFEGVEKLDSLVPVFNALVSGEGLAMTLESAKSENFVPDERELEIQQQQEFEKMRLAHGGFSDMAEFEEAVKNGGAAGYHGAHGHAGMMGGAHHGHGHAHHSVGASGGVHSPPPSDAPEVLEAAGQQIVMKESAGVHKGMPRTESPDARESGTSETLQTPAGAKVEGWANSRSEL